MFQSTLNEMVEQIFNLNKTAKDCGPNILSIDFSMITNRTSVHMSATEFQRTFPGDQYQINFERHDENSMKQYVIIKMIEFFCLIQGKLRGGEDENL